MFVYVGLGMTAVGVLAGIFVSVVVPGTTELSIAVATLCFGVSGFSPLIFVILSRPGKYLVSLQIDERQLRIEDSGRKLLPFFGRTPPWRLACSNPPPRVRGSKTSCAVRSSR